MLMIGCIDRTEEMCGVLKEGVNSSMRDHINYRNKDNNDKGTKEYIIVAKE